MDISITWLIGFQGLLVRDADRRAALRLGLLAQRAARVPERELAPLRDGGDHERGRGAVVRARLRRVEAAPVVEGGPEPAVRVERAGARELGRVAFCSFV